jgi:TonB family protein
MGYTENPRLRPVVGVAGSWRFPCICRSRNSPFRGYGAMKHRTRFAGLGMALLLTAAAIVAPRASAQDATSEGGRRKVRTRIEPEYPQVARQMNIAGRVKIEATISPDGHVVSTKVIGGSPFLVNAALEALRKWRFETSPKESTETFEFEFNRNGAQSPLADAP